MERAIVEIVGTLALSREEIKEASIEGKGKWIYIKCASGGYKVKVETWKKLFGAPRLLIKVPRLINK